MHYYEGHEVVYRRLRDQGCRSWDEYIGQAADFENFCMKPFIEEALRQSRFINSAVSALEIGCGTGPISCFLAKQGFAVEGIDISQTAIEIAQKNAGQMGLTIDFRQADVCQQRLTLRRYDVIVDGHCLHCIVTPRERQFVLKNIFQGLRVNGQFWLETMLAGNTTDFGKDNVLDDDGVLWVKTGVPGRFDLEKQIAGVTHVAGRKIIRAPTDLENELNAAGFVIRWSNTVAAKNDHDSEIFHAICVAEKPSAG